MTSKKLLAYLADLFLLLLLLGFAWFLMDDSLHFMYMQTGYPDWIFHAFRIDEIDRFGMLPWSTIWSNGLNYWKAYQYVPHVLTLLLKHALSISTTYAMIVTATLIVFLSIIEMYGIMRYLKIKSLATLVAILIFLTTPNFWGATSDFSIFFPFAIFPIFIGLWISDIRHERNSFRLPALSGIMWVIHPILGYTSLFLWLFSFKPVLSFSNLSKIFARSLIYLITFSIFLIPYLKVGYHFTSPGLATTLFVRTTLSNNSFGLGFINTIIAELLWVLIVIRARKVPKWTKILLLFVTVFFSLIFLGWQGYLPPFILQLQISRAMPLLAMCLAFCAAAGLNVVLQVRTRLASIIALALAAGLVAQIIETSASTMGRPAAEIKNPVGGYFNVLGPPKGEVYINDVSQASFFAPVGTRFVNSYNNHMEPHPLSIRFNTLLKNDLAYTGITKKQVDLINTYSQVLGVEYIFLPPLSPVVTALSATNSATNTFRLTENNKLTENFAVLHNSQKTSNAYLVAPNTQLSFDLLPLPNINSSSWQIWDEEIQKVQQLMIDQKLKPIDISFPAPNQISVDLSNQNQQSNNGVLITQSYDPNWTADVPNVTITPTSTRFMYLQFPNGVPAKVTLTNNWPKWHWPLQIGCMILAVFIIIFDTLRLSFFGKARTEHNDVNS